MIHIGKVHSHRPKYIVSSRLVIWSRHGSTGKCLSLSLPPFTSSHLFPSLPTFSHLSPLRLTVNLTAGKDSRDLEKSQCCSEVKHQKQCFSQTRVWCGVVDMAAVKTNQSNAAQSSIQHSRLVQIRVEQSRAEQSKADQRSA